MSLEPPVVPTLAPVSDSGLAALARPRSLAPPAAQARTRRPLLAPAQPVVESEPAEDPPEPEPETSGPRGLVNGKTTLAGLRRMLAESREEPEDPPEPRTPKSLQSITASIVSSRGK